MGSATYLGYMRLQYTPGAKTQQRADTPGQRFWSMRTSLGQDVSKELLSTGAFSKYLPEANSGNPFRIKADCFPSPAKMGP